MSLKETQEQLVENMRRWQKMENAGIASTGKIIEKTGNPIVRLIMEIIQRDSAMHYRVQEMIADSLTTKVVTLTPEELGAVWDMVEEHIELERSTIDLAKTALDATAKSKAMMVQNYLLKYVLKDEEKHEALLADLEQIKKGMYPYG